MALMMLMAVRPEIMGQFDITLRLRILGWASTGAMALAVIAMFGSAEVGRLKQFPQIAATFSDLALRSAREAT
jgi:hypothetical protein